MTLLLSKQDQSEKSPPSFGSRPHTAKTAHTLPKVILSSKQIQFSREPMINSSEQTKFSRESMSVSGLAVVEFPLAAAKIECAEEIHACENLKFTRIDVSSHVWVLALSWRHTYLAFVSHYFQDQSINIVGFDLYVAPFFRLLLDISCVLLSYHTTFETCG